MLFNPNPFDPMGLEQNPWSNPLMPPQMTPSATMPPGAGIALPGTAPPMSVPGQGSMGMGSLDQGPPPPSSGMPGVVESGPPPPSMGVGLGMGSPEQNMTMAPPPPLAPAGPPPSPQMGMGMGMGALDPFSPSLGNPAGPPTPDGGVGLGMASAPQTSMSGPLTPDMGGGGNAGMGGLMKGLAGMAAPQVPQGQRVATPPPPTRGPGIRGGQLLELMQSLGLGGRGDGYKLPSTVNQGLRG